MQKAAENKDSHLARLVKELQDQVEELKREKEDLKGEVEIVNTDRDGLEAEIDELRAALQAQGLKISQERALEGATAHIELQSQVQVLRKALEEKSSEAENLMSQIQTQSLCIESYRETIHRHSMNEAELANKLMCLKSELLGTNRSFQEFRVTKINSLFNAQVKIVAGANADGAKVLILEYKNKRDVYDLAMIESVAMHDSRPARFLITINGECMEFESDEAEKTVKALNAMISL